MVCTRIKDMILHCQSVDQAAYRSGFTTEDHLLALTLLVERTSEWNLDMWYGLVDFEKAFDTVEHDALWKSLLDHKVPTAYIVLLSKLYEAQTARVMERGVKQGDPISALLFISVMESIFTRLKRRWQSLNTRRKGTYYGLVIDDVDDPLFDLRFADDVLLIATSASDVAKMIKDLAEVAQTFGLKIHSGKTVVLSNAVTRPSTVVCGNSEVRVVCLDGSEKYLGRKVCLADYHDTELSYRIACGWAAFMKSKECLCNKQVDVQLRFRLFDAVVTPCVMYGCVAWTLKSDGYRRLTVARRRMLRWMLRCRRLLDESWVDYIKRATYECESLGAACGMTDWGILYKQRKWKFAGQSARRRDGRWTARLLKWIPWFWTAPFRRVGRPQLRWDDDISELAGGRWDESAQDVELWSLLSAHFCAVGAG